MDGNKVIIRLNGGLGNQMFQWAFAKMVQATTDMDVYLDMSYFEHHYARPYQLNIFKLEPKFVDDFATKLKLKIIWAVRGIVKDEKFLGYTFCSEKQFNFDPHILKIKPNSYIEGFFQTELYFKWVEKELRDDFIFLPSISDETRQIESRIRSSNSVSLHIRRGDYVQKKRYQQVYANCSIEYYQKAVDYIAKSYPEPTLFIFSDDIPWVRKNLNIPYRCVFVSHNTGLQSFEDMYLMSLCSHNIIANSSFSWWGAWLNKNPDKIVIAPEKWFNDDKIIQTDVIPKEWVRLANSTENVVVTAQ